MKSIIKRLIPKNLISEYHKFRRQRVYKKQLAVYQGDEVVCSICQSRFKKFAPSGIVQRENAKCHVCGSLERHRLLWKYLQEKTDLFEVGNKTKLLHFAPEEFFYTRFAKNINIDYVPCDLFPEIYNYKGKVKIRKVDIVDIPYETACFDVILCNHVLEHIPDDNKAMSELYRVMKKGGWGIFQVPIDYKRKETYEDFSIITPAEREKAFGQRDHVRWYGQDYKERLKAVGFDVIQDDYVKTFSSDELFKFGLMRSELIYFCRK